MPKYSTGKSNAGSQQDTSCQFCGETDAPLTTAELEGTTVTVCKSCEPNSSDRDDNVPDESRTNNTPNQSTQPETSETNPSSGYTIDNTNPDWIENANYGNADTPYMQKNYAAKLRHALDEAGVTPNELSQETGIPVDAIEAVKQGNAFSEEVGQEAIDALEEVLEIQLKEDL